MASFSSILNQLPPRIRSRFNGLPAYAKAVIEYDEKSLSLARKTSREQMEQIQVLFQLVLLDRFFRRGTEVAKQAVHELKAIGVDGFSVGSTTFEKDNDAVTRGDKLSKQLRKISPLIATLSDRFNNASASELALKIRSEVKHA